MKKDELEKRLNALKNDVAAEAERETARRERAEAQAQAQRDRELAEAEAELDLELGHTRPADRGRRAEKADKAGGNSTLKQLRDKYDAQTALSIAASARREIDKGTKEGQKSLVMSGLLSLVFGPLGWLYAGSFREAIPVSLAFVLTLYLVPSFLSFLLFPLLFVAMPISGIAGLVYAWQHNRKGQRSRILGDGKGKDEDGASDDDDDD